MRVQFVNSPKVLNVWRQSPARHLRLPPGHATSLELAFIKKYETCMSPIIRVQLAEPSATAGDRSGLQCPFFGRKTRERER